ncbi:hypothetical protein [Pandoraea sp. NPDC090278]|uniref:hypothetical protein n=1 Tax=Pandoraea sp. NPDC090278 TaxID=3364391 RepID=UPI00383A7C24
MTIDALKLLECAERIFKADEGEATLRAVASRAYYAGYHAAKGFHEALATPGSVMQARGRHEQLLAQLANPGISKNNRKHTISVALSKSLRPTYSLRVTADYHLHRPITQLQVSDSLAACRHVVEVANLHSKTD